MMHAHLELKANLDTAAASLLRMSSRADELAMLKGLVRNRISSFEEPSQNLSGEVLVAAERPSLSGRLLHDNSRSIISPSL